MKTSAGSLGPRLAGRLTAELILRSPQYMSCIGLYHLDLRGNKIGSIENLGATQNQFDSIDLSDNALIRLEGFPKLARLKMLICCNNRISSISHGLHEFLPNIDTLVLSNNKLEHLSDLDSLAPFTHLKYLCVLECPINKLRDFRLYAIFKIPSLKVIDFKRVKDKERAAAKAKFGSLTAEQMRETAAPQAAPLLLVNSAGAAVGAPFAAPTAEQMVAIKAAIANAQTLEEVQRLEAALQSGRVPEGIVPEAAVAEPEAAMAEPEADAVIAPQAAMAEPEAGMAEPETDAADGGDVEPAAAATELAATELAATELAATEVAGDEDANGVGADGEGGGEAPMEQD